MADYGLGYLDGLGVWREFKGETTVIYTQIPITNTNKVGSVICDTTANIVIVPKFDFQVSLTQWGYTSINTAVNGKTVSWSIQTNAAGAVPALTLLILVNV